MIDYSPTARPRRPTDSSRAVIKLSPEQSDALKAYRATKGQQDIQSNTMGAPSDLNSFNVQLNEQPQAPIKLSQEQSNALREYRESKKQISPPNGSPADGEKTRGIIDNMINLAKALPASVGSTVDLLGLLYNLSVNAHNFNTEQELKMSPFADRLTEEERNKTISQMKLPEVGSLEKKIEDTLGVERTPAYEGLKFASSLAIPGGAAKTLATKAPTVAKGLSAVGSLRKADLAAAGAAGATIEATRDSFGDLGALGAGLTTGLATQALPAIVGKGKIRNAIAKNLSKDFKNEIYEAAKDINVPIPLGAVTDSKMVKILNENISRYPLFGDRIHKAFEQTTKSFQEGMDKLLEKVGPSLTPKIENTSNALYDKARKALPQNVVVSSEKILNRIDEIRKDNRAFYYDEEYEKLLESLDKIESNVSLKGKFGRVTPPIPMDMVVNTKKQVNKGLTGNIKGAKKIFSHLNKAFLETIKDYGRTDPKWYKKFQKAEKFFSSYARRSEIDKAFEGKLRDPLTFEVREVPLVKTLEIGNKKDTLKRAFGKENYKTVEKFVNTARGINKYKQMLNPSGTAPQAAVLSFVGTAAALLMTAPKMLIGHAGTLYGTHKIANLLVDREFVDLVAKYAKTPSASLADNIERIVKDRSGVTLQTLNHDLNSVLHKKEAPEKDKKEKSKKKIEAFKKKIRTKN